ncbi:MAG: hypothetical protein MI867_25485 [Pseudomonadales bacterium]|nr:hypothetical protein [Pseudomonadales bacterium]
MNENNNQVTTSIFFTLVLFVFFTPNQGFSQIAGYNVISVHGFIITDLLVPPSKETVLSRKPIGGFWASHSEGFLNWNGAERLEAGISEMIFEQAKQHAENDLCRDGCVLVTHSTGDLVARYFMANQEAWLAAAGYEPLNIIATIDLAGAGGGTDLADIAVGAANSEHIPLFLKLMAGAVLGLDLDFTDYDELGVVLDLTTSAARNTTLWPNDIPRLRFSVSGGRFLNPIMGPVRAVTKTMLGGADDTVVPAHSSCAAAMPGRYRSCSKDIGYNGKQKSQYGPDAYLHNHFPVLMADKYDHFDIIDDRHRGPITYVFNNFDAGLNIDFETETRTVKRRWWEFWKETGTWQYVADSDTKSFVQLIYDTLNE